MANMPIHEILLSLCYYSFLKGDVECRLKPQCGGIPKVRGLGRCSSRMPFGNVSYPSQMGFTYTKASGEAKQMQIVRPIARDLVLHLLLKSGMNLTF
jgi:hypothetical protein